MRRESVRLINSAPQSMVSDISYFGEEEGIMCQRCNTGTGRHNGCWRETYEAGSPDLKLDAQTIRRFS